MQPNPLLLSNQFWLQMRRHVAHCAPEEACGLLGGKGGRVLSVHEIENQLHSRTRYRLDPVEQLQVFRWLDEQDLELVAIYHSHPAGPAHPSETDVAEFAYPDVLTVIWFPVGVDWQARAYRIQDGSYAEVAVAVEDGSQPISC